MRLVGFRHELIAMCAHAGFAPRITSVSDDMVVMQALVAAGMGVTTLPDLALEARRVLGIHATSQAARATPGRHRKGGRTTSG